MIGTRRVGIGLFFFLSTAALATGCSGGGGGAKDHKPVAADDTATTNENVAVEIDVLANDTDADKKDVLTIENVGTPAHGTAVIDNGKVLYTPAANYSGSDTFTYTISDGRTFTPPPGANVAVTITHVNQAPVAVADSATVAEDGSIDIDVLANDTDVDGDTLTIASVATPAHGSASISSGKIHYAPAANFNGADSVGYTISDGNGGTASGTIAITVTAVDDAPVAAADAYSGVEDTTLSIPAPGVLGNDTDVDGPALTAVLVAQATKGTVTLAADGSFTYVPNDNANGTDSFTYHANDGTLNSGTVTVTLTIAPVNDPPAAAADAYSTAEDTALTVNAANGVLANDTDIDSATLTAVLVSGPSKGTLSLAADGSFTYTPNANVNGTDSFRYQANDGSLLSTVATVTLTITPVNDPPVANDDAYTTNEDTPLTIAAPGVQANDSDIDGPTAIPTAFPVATPTKGTLSLLTTGAFTYTPNANANGTDSFTYQINDGLASSNTATVTLTINAVNDAPSFTAGANQTALEDSGAHSVAGWATGISAGPADEAGQAVTFQVSSDNPGLFSAGPAVAANGTLTYTLAADANGVANVTVKAHDDGGTANGGVDTSAPQTFTITVTPVNDAPSFVSGGDVTVAEDSGAYVNPWATSISAGPANESSQQLTFVVTGDTNASIFSLPPAVTPGGVLSFETNPNANGNATITLHLADDGGTANGGADHGGDVTFTIHVTPVNDPPVAKDDDYVGTENQPLTIAAASGLLANDSDIDGPSVSVDVASVVQPANGSVSVNANGSFTYTPNANFHGGDSFTYRATDGSLDSPAATVAVAVDARDLAPSFSAGGDVTVLQDSATYSASWATSISQGAGESGQALTFAAVASDPSLFSVPPSIDAAGHLTFKPAPGASGSSAVSVTLTDDNGSPADPTDDATSAPQVFTIHVTPVPSFTVSGNLEYAQGSGTQTIPGFAQNIRTVGTPSFEVYFDDGGLFDFNCSPTCGNPQLDASGTLSFRLAPAVNGQTGIAHLTAVMTDSANGQQASQTFTLKVDFVNQPPTFLLSAPEIVLQDNDSAPHDYPNFATNVFPGAFDEFGQTLTFSLSFDPSQFFTAPTIDGSGTLHLAPKGASLPGTVTVFVTLSDDGRRPDGTTGPTAQTTQTFDVVFHDHTQVPHFTSSTPSNGSFVNQQTAGFFTGTGELTPMKLFFDSPDVDCAGMRSTGDINVTNLTENGVGTFAIQCPGDGGVSVPAGEIWLAFNSFDSQPQGDQLQVDLTNIRGSIGGSDSATILFTYDDRPPTATYIASASSPFFTCAPANTRAIFSFGEAMDTGSGSTFVFAHQASGGGAGTPVAADPAGEGFASLDGANDAFYFVPNDLLTPGGYDLDLSRLTDVAGNPVQNANTFTNLGVCGGPPTGPQEPALVRIDFRQGNTGVIDATVSASEIANQSFLAPPQIDATNDDVVLTFDQILQPGANANLEGDSGPGNQGIRNVGYSTSGATLVFRVSQAPPPNTWATGVRYKMNFNVCNSLGGSGFSCSGSDLQFYVQTTGVTSPPFVDALVARGARASDGSIPAVRPQEPWTVGFSGLVDPRTLVPSSFQLVDGNGVSWPVVVGQGDGHLGAVNVALRAADGSGSPIALPAGSYTLTVTGLHDLNQPYNKLDDVALAFDVIPHPSTPSWTDDTPHDGDTIFAQYFGRATSSVFLAFDDLMSPQSFVDTGNPATRGFSLTEDFAGSFGDRFIPLKGLSPGTLNCCGNESGPTADPLSTLQLTFGSQGFGGSSLVGFEPNRVYEFTVLDGLANVDGTGIGNAGGVFDFATAQNESDANAFPTIEQYSFGGQLFPDGSFTCSICGGTPSSGLAAQIEYQDPTSSSSFLIDTPLGGVSVAENGGASNDDVNTTYSFSSASIATYFTPGDNAVTYEAQDDGGSGNVSTTSFTFHLPQLPPAPTSVVSTNGTTVTLSGSVPLEDGPYVSRIEVGVLLTDESGAVPDLRAFGPSALANVTRNADGSLTWSQTFDATLFPPKTSSSAAYRALMVESVPDGLTSSFSSNGGGGNGGKPGFVDAFQVSATIPVQGPPPPPPMIRGTLLDVMGNVPIAGATVSVDGVTGNTSTSPSGAWALPMPTPGPTYWVRSTNAGYFDGLEPDRITGPATGLGPMTISDSEFQSFVTSASLPAVDLTSGDVIVVTNNGLLQQSWVDIGTPSTLDGNVNGGGGNPIYLFENATPGDSTLTITPQGGASCVWNTRTGTPVFGPPYDLTPLRIGSHGFTVIEIDCN